MGYLQSQAKIAKAATIKKGTIIEGVVRQQVGKGLLMELGGEAEGKPVGMLALEDISRLKVSAPYALKTFPPGTKIKCYVIHSDESNGRITLGTKEFEDDDHVGWMLYFPAWCFRHAEES